MRRAHAAAYAGFSLLLAVACCVRPVSDDFDRYIYEAILRSRTQSPAEIYRTVKHESPRAEASSILDSPEHMAQLEPLYAIRPLYIQAAELLYRAGLKPQLAINLVSAGSLFLLAFVLYSFTQSYLYSALLLCFPSVLLAGRIGTPDAFSSVLTVAGIAALIKERTFYGVLLLMVSIWARTDNLLIVLAFVACLAWQKKIRWPHAGVLCAVAVASVQWINALSGNYGWKVLLHYSFVGGKYPAQITQGITLFQYAHAAGLGLTSVAPQLAPWLLLGLAAWRLGSRERRFLVPVAMACALHFLLFPSREARYFTWAYLVTGAVFVRALQSRGAVIVSEVGVPHMTAAA